MNRLAETRSAIGGEMLATHLTQSSHHPVIYYWNNIGNVSDLSAFVQQFVQVQPLGCRFTIFDLLKVAPSLACRACLRNVNCLK